MTPPARPGAIWLAVALAAASPSAGCASAVKHPAITAGIVAGTLGLGTCKLASDNTAACFAVGGGAGAFLGLVTATALWLGGDGNTVMTEDPAQPLPLEDTRPRRRRPHPPDPATADPAQPPAAPATAPVPADPAPPPAAPAPASPDAPSAAEPAPVSPPATPTMPAPTLTPPSSRPPGS